MRSVACALALCLGLISAAHAQLITSPPTKGLWAPITNVTSAAGVGYSSWVNQGAASETDTSTGMAFNLPSNQGVHAVNGIYKAAPAIPYTVTALILLGGAPQLGNDANALIGWYDGANGVDALAINVYYGMISVGHFWYATPTTPMYAPNMDASCPPTIRTWGVQSFPCQTSVLPIAASTNYLWVQLTNSGTAITVSASLDGINYTALYSYTITNGPLLVGYNDLLIGGDPYLGPLAFTVASYVD